MIVIFRQTHLFIVKTPLFFIRKINSSFMTKANKEIQNVDNTNQSVIYLFLLSNKAN